jgi:hypothetical protein
MNLSERLVESILLTKPEYPMANRSRSQGRPAGDEVVVWGVGVEESV